MRVWTVTVASFPNHHDLDTGDYLDMVGDAVRAVCSTEQGAILAAKAAIASDFSYPDDREVGGWEQRKEGDTTFLVGKPDLDDGISEVSDCCFARIVPFDVQ